MPFPAVRRPLKDAGCCVDLRETVPNVHIIYSYANSIYVELKGFKLFVQMPLLHAEDDSKIISYLGGKTNYPSARNLQDNHGTESSC